ncbi:NADPH-dependent FMN reductase [Wenjunlia vitaminophila]|uniref:NADPH-dependent FMN reductase n=1 Tax=Wenjunlia vitaminophila TaxID=76728 RepID=A0A0T6LQM2_WENVI|nr:NAD(P)H-dependent oxidoreductase [Wenjunlia vitaminophila]KRV48414.1 NADPH-dependent FMN reductase [Wenjunlia vitaminophila]
MPIETSPAPLRLAVIVGSTRENRFAPTVADWFTARAEQHDGFDLDVLDLAELALPASLLANPVVDGEWVSPALGELTERIDAADVFVVITPEYNHGYPASLKHAIDSVGQQWRAKALGFVSYGGVSGGLRSVEQLRQVFAELHVVTVRDSVSIAGAWRQFDADGAPVNPEQLNAAAKVMLDQLVWWGRTLREGRAARPYRG